MFASYAGAEAAIKQRLRDNWTTTEIVMPNERRSAVAVDVHGNPLPFVALEIESDGTQIYGQGAPGNHTWHTEGAILVHVFVPTNTGDGDAVTYATAIGEIFRAKKFYDGVTPGCYVRSWAPNVDGGGAGTDDGLWWRRSVTIDFEYWHRG